MAVWDLRVKEIRESLDRFEQNMSSRNFEMAANELEFIEKHLYSLKHGV